MPLSFILRIVGEIISISSLLLAVVAIIILANPFETISLASIILGVSVVVSGLSDIIIYLIMRRKVSRSLQRRDDESGFAG